MKGNYFLNALTKHVTQGITQDAQYWFGPSAPQTFSAITFAKPEPYYKGMTLDPKITAALEIHSDALRVIKSLPVMQTGVSTKTPLITLKVAPIIGPRQH